MLKLSDYLVGNPRNRSEVTIVKLLWANASDLSFIINLYNSD